MKVLKALLTIFLVPGICFAQPSGSEMCRIWDGSQVMEISTLGSVQVEGAITEGQPYNGKPVLIGGIDYDDNNAYFADVDAADGSVRARQSGTWNIGTLTNFTNQGQLVDNAGFTDGTTRLNMCGYIFDETAGTALTENDGAASRIDSKRAQIIALEDATTRGQRATVSAAGALKVDNSAVTQPISGTITANPGQLVYLARASNDVDNTAVLVFDCSAANSSSKFITVTNAGDGDLYCTINDSTPVSDGSTADYDWKLARGQTEWIPVAYKASSTDNDIYCLRASAQTNDNVLVTQYGWAN